MACILAKKDAFLYPPNCVNRLLNVRFLGKNFVYLNVKQ